MIVVLDASAAVRAAYDSDDRKWESIIIDADLVLAPELFGAEVANAFWKYARAGLLSKEEAAARFRKALGLVDEFRTVSNFASEAFDLGVLLERPVYDLFYVVLARRESAKLLTADKGLANIARRLGVSVVAVR
ncbi:MAG: type II toxin-antitoxin system VapC family toxin [Bryobacterales bacterium]|nr:type II toxin-antitoxin system VapC family toxin [Bryobacterales bacterium]